MAVLTVEWLSGHCACDKSLRRFKKLFGKKCPVTEANVRAWLAGRFNVEWSLERDGLQWLVWEMLDDRRLCNEVAEHIKSSCQCVTCVTYNLFGLPEERMVKAVVQIAERAL